MGVAFLWCIGYDVQEEDNEMEITLGDDGCIEMDVEINVEQMMITEVIQE